MIATQHIRHKRNKKRATARPKTDDEVGDADFPNHLWPPLVALSLILLAAGTFAGFFSAPAGDVFKVLYALVCLILFIVTTLYLGNAAKNDIEAAHLNGHIYRKQTLRQVVRGVGSIWLFASILYVPSIIIPASVFRAGWLGYVMLLVEGCILAFSAYVIVRWLEHRAGRHDNPLE